MDGDEHARLMSHLEELRTGMAILAACLEAAALAPGEGPRTEEAGGLDPDSLRAYA